MSLLGETKQALRNSLGYQAANNLIKTVESLLSKSPEAEVVAKAIEEVIPVVEEALPEVEKVAEAIAPEPEKVPEAPAEPATEPAPASVPETPVVVEPVPATEPEAASDHAV